MAAATQASAPARAPIDRERFFGAIRASGVFGPTLSQTEVDGLNGILDAWAEQGWPADLRWVAYTIATAWHEARLDGRIREWGRGEGKPYGRPAGPYGKVYYGRSYPQLTWLDNYERFSKLIGVDLVKDPDLVLDPTTGAAILIIGSRDGLFRKGKTLARFFNATTDNPVAARDIINGDIVANGGKIAGYHVKVLACLREACVPATAIPVPPATPKPLPPVASGPVPPLPPTKPVAADPSRNWLQRIGDRLRAAYPRKA